MSRRRWRQGDPLWPTPLAGAPGFLVAAWNTPMRMLPLVRAGIIELGDIHEFTGYRTVRLSLDHAAPAITIGPKAEGASFLPTLYAALCLAFSLDKGAAAPWPEIQERWSEMDAGQRRRALDLCAIQGANPLHEIPSEPA